jgi:hypothetical protein
LSRGPSAFRQTDVTRAVRGVEAAGVKVTRVEIVAGKIVLYSGESQDAPANELDRWIERDARKA